MRIVGMNFILERKPARRFLFEFLLQLAHGFQNHVAYDGHVARANFVQRVLRRVPVARRNVVVQVDDVERRHAARQKRLVVVVYAADFLVNEDVLVAQAVGGFPDQIREPFGRIGFFGNFQAILANHVRQNYRFDAFQFAGNGHPRGEFAAAVGVVVVFVPVYEGLFAIEEGHPYRIWALLRTKMTRQFDHHAGGGGAVFGAYEILHAAQRIVVRQQQNNSGPSSGRFGHDVLHGDIAFRCGCVEVLLLHLAPLTFQLRADVLLNFVDAVGSGRARPETDDLGHLVEGLRAVESAGLIRRWSRDTRRRRRGGGRGGGGLTRASAGNHARDHARTGGHP